MRNNKGFTLIELLAILVILAIIAVITTPIILGVIENARKDAAADKAWGIIDAIKLAYTQDQTGNTPGYTAGDTITFGGETSATVGSVDIKASGQMPSDGTASIAADGTITVTDLTFDAYKCSNSGNPNKMECTKSN